MSQIHQILKSVWGYDDFRPLQEDIIKSVLKGHDTLGLMPTGGGKSLTFQVPALVLQGVCIVVTPLIALMKDQVANLRTRNVTAAAIFTGMTPREINQTLENAVHEAYKFLYVSPERLATEMFLLKVRQMNVSLIAVDESHCISQWGYDFRPAYLKIADIRKELPDVPVLALTATATPEVVDDIQNKLQFKKKNLYQKSFYRSNLAYVVRDIEDKNSHLLKILQSVPGSSVVYVRSRKKTKEIAEWLMEQGIVAEHFHAGLKNESKDARQQRWKDDQTRVIVATNAFGMGIDKPNVRTVIHMDLPDSIEAYFQEAGRAGRDEQKAYAILLFNNSDVVKMRKRIIDTFPEKEKVKEVYDALGNYFQLGVGSGLDRSFEFELNDFCRVFKFPLLHAHNSIKLLQYANYIDLSDDDSSRSRVVFSCKKDDLYKHKHSAQQEKLIHTLLRSYTGMFTDYVYISEELLAKRLNWQINDVYQVLIGLSKDRLINYIPRKNIPYITYLQERQEKKHLYLPKEAYEDRKERYVTRIKEMVNYATDPFTCRSKTLLAYFGEYDVKDCGQCDVCLRKKNKKISSSEYNAIKEKIFSVLHSKPLSLKEIKLMVSHDENKVIEVLRFLIDNRQIEQNDKREFQHISS